MTEDEAKTKWCPLFGITTAVAGNHPEPHRPDVRLLTELRICKGSACMMWRLEIRREFERADDPSMGTVREVPIGGFCGLAGKP